MLPAFACSGLTSGQFFATASHNAKFHARKCRFFACAVQQTRAQRPGSMPGLKGWRTGPSRARGHHPASIWPPPGGPTRLSQVHAESAAHLAWPVDTRETALLRPNRAFIARFKVIPRFRSRTSPSRLAPTFKVSVRQQTLNKPSETITGDRHDRFSHPAE